MPRHALRAQCIWIKASSGPSRRNETRLSCIFSAMKFFSLVWSSLKRKKSRTILTLLSIFVAFVLYGLLCAVKEAFTAGVTMAGANRLIVRHKVSLIMSLPVSYKERMQNIPGVD